MSGKNKVNPDHYKVAGRLSTDDLARARRQQSEPTFGAARSGRDKPMPPWMLNDQLGRTEPGDSGNTDAAALDDSEDKQAVSTAEKPKARPRAKAKTAKTKAGAATASKASAKPRTARKTAKSRKVTISRGSGRTSTTRAAAKSARSLAKKAPRRTAKRPIRAAGKKSTRAAAAKSRRKATTKRKTTR